MKVIEIALVNNTIIHVEENIALKLNAADISKALGYSERHLRRVFQETTKITLKEYVTQRKVVNAMCDSLVKNIHKEEVSKKYGYNSYDSFLRAFRRVLGLTPEKFLELDATSIVYKEILPGLTIPTINLTKLESIVTNNKKTKDLLWNKNIVTSPLFVVKINDAGYRLIKELTNMGLRESNIKKHQTYISKPVHETVKSIVNSVDDIKNDRPVTIIVHDRFNQQVASKIQKSLFVKGIISFLVLDSPQNDVTTSDILSITKFSNNLNSKSFSYKKFLQYLLNNSSLRIRKNKSTSSKAFIVIKSKEFLNINQILSITSEVETVLGYEVIIDKEHKGKIRVVYMD